MKKITTILMLLMLTCMGAKAGEVTNRASAGSPMTYNDFVALAGTGKHFALMATSSNATTYPKWFSFSKAGYPETLTTVQLFELENSETGAGWYNIKRVSDGLYVSEEGGSFAATPKLDFKLDNRKAGDYHSEFANEGLHISFDNAAGKHFNANPSNVNFQGGSGGYSTYVAFGPFYLVTVDCQEGGTSLQGYPQTLIVTESHVLTAPDFLGKSVVGQWSYTINQDYTSDNAIVFYYEAASSFDYTLVVNGAPEGTTITIKGNPVALDAGTVSFDSEVTESDVVVTFPTDYSSYMTATKTIEGSVITITCTDTRWPVNFDKSLRSTHNSRFTDFVGLDDQKITIPGAAVGGLIYRDLTSESLTVAAGTTVTPKFGYRGWAMYGYLYIDYNDDGDFEDEGELVSQLPGNNWPSQSTADKSIPPFTVANAAGTHRARFKIEWNNTNPGGNADGSIAGNGGCMIDVMITVIATTAEQNAAYEKVQSWFPFMQNSMALVTDASNYLSNAKQSNEGSYAALLDKNNASFFHSQWSGSMVNVPGHDLQARLPEAVNSFYLFYVTRDNGRGYPMTMRIDGSNNASDFSEAGGTGWTNDVASLSSLPSGSTTSYLSDKISMSDAYQYLRFVPTIGNNDDANWFCLAEFWLFPSNATIDAAINMMKSVNSVFDITPEMITAINQIDEDLRNTTANVTYVVKDESGTTTLFTSEPQTVAKGTTITTLPADFQRPLFYTYNTANVTVDGEKTIEFTATWKADAPFVQSTSYADATWYYATIRGSKYLRADETAKDGDGRYLTNNTNEETDVYQWAFFGNPYTNFWIANKGHNAGKYLYASDTTAPTMTAVEDPANTNAAKWEIIANGDGFNLRSLTGDNLYINDNANKGNIGYWNSTLGRLDDGGKWNATKVPSAEDKYQALIVKLQSIPFGKGVNQYSLTYQGEDYTERADQAITLLLNTPYSTQSMEAAQLMLAGASLNLPKPGFYRIKGEDSQKYLSTGEFVNDNGTNKFPMVGAEDAGTNTIFYFDGTKLINYGDGMANGMSASAWAWVYGPAASTVEFGDGNTNGGYYIKSANAYFFDKGGDRSCADRGQSLGTDTRYRCWKLKEVTELPITLRSADGVNYFATFSAPVNVQIADASLNRVEKVENKIQYTAVTTNLLPANTGVLLTGTSATATATVITDEVTGANYGLVGYDAATAGTGDATKLYLGKGKTSGDAGFYKLGDGKTSNGFKAYFDNSSSTESGAHAIDFEGFELEEANGETTGVETIGHGTLNKENGAVYNLQGQKVTKAQKGVYIQNGKKVVLK